MIKDNQKEALLENLRKIPIVQLACQKAGVSRATYYRWCKRNKKFALEVDEAMREGIAMVNDLSEAQLITAIKEKNFSAIRFWLQNRHKAYANRVEVLDQRKEDNPKLNAEQKKIMKEALRLASAGGETKKDGAHKPRKADPADNSGYGSAPDDNI